jgi:NADPH2:quinone reductase
MYATWYEHVGPAEQVMQAGEREIPTPQPDEVLVRIYTSGINPSDVKRRARKGLAPDFPLTIPNSDGAGVIEAVGSNVSRTRIGERVWLWNAQFLRPYGTAAEYIALPAAQAIPLPDGIDFATGATLGIPALTAHRVLFADGPIIGQTILIAGGAGAVGYAALQLAKWGGATVITTISTAEKAALAQAGGADYVINYREEDVYTRVREITQGRGVDRIVELAFTANAALDVKIIKQNGTIAVYGSDFRTDDFRFPLFELLTRDIQLRFTLVYILTPKARQQAIEDVHTALLAGALKPIIAARFPLSESVQAQQAVEHGRGIGNIILDVYK